MMTMVSLGSVSSILVVEPLKTHKKSEEFSVYLNVGTYKIAGLIEEAN